MAKEKEKTKVYSVRLLPSKLKKAKVKFKKESSNLSKFTQEKINELINQKK